MMTRDCAMEFFGRRGFDSDARNNFREKWSNMTTEEKVAFMDKRFEAMENEESPFSVKAIDARCEEWIKKTPEEKEAFIKAKKEAMHDRHFQMHNHFGHGRFFGFGF